MAYSILSEAVRHNLEQERARLVSDRDAIIASVTAELDRLIDQLDGLLGEATIAPIQPELPEIAAVATSLPEEASPRSKGKAKPKAKAKARRVQSFDAKQFKHSFQGMTASEAVVEVMAQAPDKLFETDALIEALYEPFAESDWGRARKSVSAVLLHGIRSGKFKKVQENPAQYQLQASAEVTD